MGQAKTLELNILLALRNNKTVPIRKVHELFDQDWSLYRSKFNELIIKSFFKISTEIPGICTFELNQKGNDRINELLIERAKEIEIRLSQLNEIKRVIGVRGRSKMPGIFSFLKRFPSHGIEAKSA
jgi:hypothetical protein